MSEENCWISGTLPMTEHLDVVVRKLLKTIDREANSIQVNVVIANLTPVGGATVLGYPLHFVSPSPEHEAGTVYLTFGVGNLE